MTQQPTRTRSKEYARIIPTKEQLAYAARRQAQLEARQQADPSYSGHYAGIHPENRPDSSQDLIPVPFDDEDYAIEEDESYYTTRLPTSTRRYQGYSVSP